MEERRRTTPHPHAHHPRPIRWIEERIHSGALSALGLTEADRDSVVEAMFTRRRRDAVSYWLQLLLSMGIATVGLVLGSTAVVIGAMLIAPLMGPIVELGMALVLGSPVLTIRSFGRMVGSVVAVVAGAALLTLVLPFQEINAEIASRTSPTALDLLLAIFVALAAAFTTVRSSSETTSAAAGTAIGIALVPPVCVIGFGLGIGDASVAGGATLLFVTNLTAILFVSVVAFWTLGFETVDAAEWEDAALAEANPHGATHNAVRVLRAAFGSRYGRVMRVAIPLLLVGTIAVPLSSALEKVAWEVRARAAVSRIIGEALESRNAVQSMVSVKQGSVATQLYLVGSTREASTLEEELLTRLAAATGVIPTVRVVAVPDVEAIRQVSAPSAEPPKSSMLPPAARLGELREELAGAVQAAWPAEQLGPLLGWGLEVQDTLPPRLVIRHVGAAAGPAVDRLLGRAVSDRIGTTLEVESRAYSLEPVTAPVSEGAAWLPDLARALHAAQFTEGLVACVRIPEERILARSRAQLRLASVVREEAKRLAAGRVTVDQEASLWSVRLSATPCKETSAGSASPAEAAAPGG